MVKRATLIEIETERLLLRQFEWDDLDDLVRICGDARVMKYIGLRGEPMAREETRQALSSIFAHWQRHGFGRWAAVHKNECRLIGYSGLRSFGKDAELVYLLDFPYWGHGLATEMARACLGFAFERRAFDYVVAMTKPDNLASRRVLEKVGLQYRQTIKFFRHMAEMGLLYPKGDELADMDVAYYSISSSEYRPASQLCSDATSDQSEYSKLTSSDIQVST